DADTETAVLHQDDRLAPAEVRAGRETERGVLAHGAHVAVPRILVENARDALEQRARDAGEKVVALALEQIEKRPTQLRTTRGDSRRTCRPRASPDRCRRTRRRVRGAPLRAADRSASRCAA